MAFAERCGTRPSDAWFRYTQCSSAAYSWRGIKAEVTPRA